MEVQDGRVPLPSADVVMVAWPRLMGTGGWVLEYHTSNPCHGTFLLKGAIMNQKSLYVLPRGYFKPRQIRGKVDLEWSHPQTEPFRYHSTYDLLV